MAQRLNPLPRQELPSGPWRKQRGNMYMGIGVRSMKFFFAGNTIWDWGETLHPFLKMAQELATNQGIRMVWSLTHLYKPKLPILQEIRSQMMQSLCHFNAFELQNAKRNQVETRALLFYQHTSLRPITLTKYNTHASKQWKKPNI